MNKGRHFRVTYAGQSGSQTALVCATHHEVEGEDLAFRFGGDLVMRIRRELVTEIAEYEPEEEE